MTPTPSFAESLASVLARQVPPRGRVRVWRRTLSENDREVFDRAVDDWQGVRCVDLTRAITASGEKVTYHMVYGYRLAVSEGGPR